MAIYDVRNRSTLRLNFDPNSSNTLEHRYFNADTGYGGQQYKKQTSDRICVELSKDNYKYMRQYVNDFAPSSSSEPEL